MLLPLPCCADLEVGGEHTALLNGVGNTVANFPSFVVPYLALWLRRRFGSFLPICAVAAGFKMLAVTAFLNWGQVTPVKTTPKD